MATQICSHNPTFICLIMGYRFIILSLYEKNTYKDISNHWLCACFATIFYRISDEKKCGPRCLGSRTWYPTICGFDYLLLILLLICYYCLTGAKPSENDGHTYYEAHTNLNINDSQPGHTKVP